MASKWAGLSSALAASLAPAAAGDGVLEVAGGGQDAGVDDEGVAVRLQGLVLQLPVADFAAFGVEEGLEQQRNGQWR